MATYLNGFVLKFFSADKDLLIPTGPSNS